MQEQNQERPIGKWLNANTETTFKCSMCGKEPMYSPYKGRCYVTLTEYCPYCGAKMDLNEYEDFD